MAYGRDIWRPWWAPLGMGIGAGRRTVRSYRTKPCFRPAPGVFLFEIIRTLGLSTAFEKEGSMGEVGPTNEELRAAIEREVLSWPGVSKARSGTSTTTRAVSRISRFPAGSGRA